ncbi:MAG: hypothetical protein ACI9K5_001004 [Gammaproteobacteria bacterium]|jgi:hypothetical protein
MLVERTPRKKSMMVPSKTLLAGLALAAMTTVGTAQTSTGLQTHAVNTVGTATLNLATGELTRGATDKTVALLPAFANTDTSGFYSTGSVVTSLGGVDEWLDFGTVTTDTGSDAVGAFTFGYASNLTDTVLGGPGAAMNLRFYDGITGFCADSGASPTASFSFDGLPAGDGVLAGGWLVTIDLTGGGSFASAGAGNAFGFGWLSDDVDGTGAAGTGPLLCYAGDGLGGADANGQEDVFDIWNDSPSTNVCLGSFFFGGPPFDFSSWYLTIDTVDGSATVSASSSFRNGGSNPGGYAVTAEPIIGGVFGATDTVGNPGGLGVLPIGYGGPLDFPSAYGQILVDITDPGGELLAAGLAFFDGAGVATIAIAVPNNLNLCGLNVSTQTIQIGGGISLHNAQDLVVGF